jgi:hypothetical protein
MGKIEQTANVRQGAGWIYCCNFLIVLQSTISRKLHGGKGGKSVHCWLAEYISIALCDWEFGHYCSIFLEEWTGNWNKHTY